MGNDKTTKDPWHKIGYPPLRQINSKLRDSFLHCDEYWVYCVSPAGSDKSTLGERYGKYNSLRFIPRTFPNTHLRMSCCGRPVSLIPPSHRLSKEMDRRICHRSDREANLLWCWHCFFGKRSNCKKKSVKRELLNSSYEVSTGKHAVMNENAHILINITANIYCLNKESNVSTRESNVPLE